LPAADLDEPAAEPAGDDEASAFGAHGLPDGVDDDV
jgi:hypothetical protein